MARAGPIALIAVAALVLLLCTAETLALEITMNGEAVDVSQACMDLQLDASQCTTNAADDAARCDCVRPIFAAYLTGGTCGAIQDTLSAEAYAQLELNVDALSQKYACDPSLSL